MNTIVRKIHNLTTSYSKALLHKCYFNSLTWKLSPLRVLWLQGRSLHNIGPKWATFFARSLFWSKDGRFAGCYTASIVTRPPASQVERNMFSATETIHEADCKVSLFLDSVNVLLWDAVTVNRNIGNNRDRTRCSLTDSGKTDLIIRINSLLYR